MFPSKTGYINIHSHHKPVLHDEFVIRNAFLKLSCGAIKTLGYPVSAGLHPWHTGQMSAGECADKLHALASCEYVLSIGETGIDRAISIPAKKQTEYFEIQAGIAAEVNKPVIIHAVRSYSDLLPYLKKTTVPFIFHGFNGNLRQAGELLKYNCRLSFGTNLFNYRADDILRQLPKGTFLLETDTARHIHIADVYNKVCEIRNTESDALKEELFYTFAAIFKPKDQ